VEECRGTAKIDGTAAIVEEIRDAQAIDERERIDRGMPPASGRVVQQRLGTVAFKSADPERDGRARDSKPMGDLMGRETVEREQHDARTANDPLWRRLAAHPSFELPAICWARGHLDAPRRVTQLRNSTR
jgi:hypothetical protein